MCNALSKPLDRPPGMRRRLNEKCLQFFYIMFCSTPSGALFSAVARTESRNYRMALLLSYNLIKKIYMRERIFNCCNVKVEVEVCDRILRAHKYS